MVNSEIRSVGALTIAFAVVCAVGPAACFDLFHSTDDFRSACQSDGQTEGCGLDASSGDGADRGDSDFCAWSPESARLRAQRACAWLGACETPMGRNAFGACMIQALLVYDCTANPNHRAKSKAHDLWDCLWRSKSCAAVDACVLPKGPQPCGSVGSYTGCGTAMSTTANNFDVRFECDYDGGRVPAGHAENCALWGQTCASKDGVAACAGSRADGLACTQSGCSPSTQLHWCADGTDIGMDCESNGAQRCDVYASDGGAQWFACTAETDAAACTPDPSAVCANGVATSCPSGVPETIDSQNSSARLRLAWPALWRRPSTGRVLAPWLLRNATGIRATETR